MSLKSFVFLFLLMTFTINTGISQSLATININPSPEMPSYDASKMSEYLLKTSKLKLDVPKSAKVIPIVARSYCLNKNRTASGYKVHSGVIATDKTFKLGTKVRLLHNGHDMGVYTVLDRGDKNIVGNNIDIWSSSCAASRQFGKRKLVMQILHVPSKWQYAGTKKRVMR